MTDRIYFPNKKKDRKAKGGVILRETTAQLPELTEEEYEKERNKLSPTELRNLESYAKSYIANPERFKGSSAELQRRIRNEARRILRIESERPAKVENLLENIPAREAVEKRLFELQSMKKNDLKQLAADNGLSNAGNKQDLVKRIFDHEVATGKTIKGSGLKMKKLKQATKTGMALKPQQRKTRMLKLEKEVTGGVDVPKHFHRYIKLMKMHDSGKKLTPRQELHLGKYSDLDGAGFFDKIGDVFKSIGKKVIDVVPKLVEHGEKIVKGVEKGKEIYDKGKKVYDVVKSFKKVSDKK